MTHIEAIQFYKEQLVRGKEKGFSNSYLLRQQEALNAVIDMYNEHTQLRNILHKLQRACLIFDTITDERHDWHFLANILGVESGPKAKRVLDVLMMLDDDYLNDLPDMCYYDWLKKRRIERCKRERDEWKQRYEASDSDFEREGIRRIIILLDKQIELNEALLNN